MINVLLKMRLIQKKIWCWLNHTSKYCHLNLSSKSIINFTAFNLTDDETKKFVEMFNNLDENGDGL